MLSGKRAYICSPLSAPDKKGISHNMDMARFYMERMQSLYHCRTLASHAYLPLMLDDSIPKEREAALRIGQELIHLCDVLIICGRRISSGMKSEIKEAFSRGMDVYWYDSEEKPFEIRAVPEWKEEWDAMPVCK